ncbi:hypothetical protein [Aeoliella sp. SH292]|uniref:hypothetical protein n=1 Tax=Aeoliella sp. SH292 TaxID=3454464 RepID=UPI003F9BB340
MTPTYRPIIIAMSMTLACFAGCSRSSSSHVSQAPLVGSWQIDDPRLVDADIRIIWTFDGSSIAVSDGAGEIFSQSSYTIDEAVVPHHITMQISDIANETRPGIYAVARDKLELSFSVDGSPRPKSFEDGESMVLKRVSP